MEFYFLGLLPSAYLYPVAISFILWLFVFLLVVQCFYALYFFLRVFDFFSGREAPLSASGPVSVIICAQNEAGNLKKNLPGILAQRYSNESGKILFEVIVVNDGSEDDTEAVLKCLAERFHNLKYISVSKEAPRNFKGKKFALSTGIEQANHPWLLLTDADCLPASEDWLARMVKPLSEGKEIVAGFGAIRSGKSFLNAFVRWETMHTFLQYSSYAHAGRPYMAVGRNLACTKAVFLKAQESAIWNQLPSGDDDLLMQACATSENTAVVAHPDSFTISDAKTSWYAWSRQKQRHLSTGKYYKKQTKILLGLYALSHDFAWILFFVLLYSGTWALPLLLMSVRSVLYWSVWQATASELGDKKLFPWLPLCDIGWTVYNFIFSPFIIWKNKQQWK